LPPRARQSFLPLLKDVLNDVLGGTERGGKDKKRRIKRGKRQD